MTELPIDAYFDELRRLARAVEITDARRNVVSRDGGFAWVVESARASTAAGGKLIFIGNGGSAAIASHMAIDYSKNGRLRAMTLNDGAALTCLGNDFGYEHVFAKQIEWHARPGDVLMAISSSGKSRSILNAVESARAAGCLVITFSGFLPDNPLRQLGDRNFYIDSSEYGFVELSHLSLCHAILDFSCEWKPAAPRETLVTP